jgi:hypothetical protein
MSVFKVTVALPRTVKMTVFASNVPTARRAAIEFTETAFANALQFWGDNEPLTGGGTAQVRMPADGMIEVVAVKVVQDSHIEEPGQRP